MNIATILQSPIVSERKPEQKPKDSIPTTSDAQAPPRQCPSPSPSNSSGSEYDYGSSAPGSPAALKKRAPRRAARPGATARQWHTLSRQEKEDRIQQALALLREDQYLNVNQASQVLKIPLSTLRYRYRHKDSGPIFKSRVAKGDGLLTLEEEEQLTNYLHTFIASGIAVDKRDVEQIVRELIYRRQPAAQRPIAAKDIPIGQNWFSKFLKRKGFNYQLTLKIKSTEYTDNKLRQIDHFYQSLAEIITCEKLGPRNIFAMDEMCFSVVDYNRSTAQALYVLPDMFENEGSTVTVVATAQAVDPVVAPFIVVRDDKFELTSTAASIPGTRICRTSNGLLNPEASIEYLKHLAAAVPDGPKLLLLDGYAQHLSFDFVTTAHQLGIRLLHFPSGMGAVLNPAEMAVLPRLRTSVAAHLTPQTLNYGALVAAVVAAHSVENQEVAFGVSGIYPVSSKRPIMAGQLVNLDVTPANVKESFSVICREAFDFIPDTVTHLQQMRYGELVPLSQYEDRLKTLARYLSEQSRQILTKKVPEMSSMELLLVVNDLNESLPKNVNKEEVIELLYGVCSLMKFPTSA